MRGTVLPLLLGAFLTVLRMFGGQSVNRLRKHERREQAGSEVGLKKEC
jgi:hypothetical protein